MRARTGTTLIPDKLKPVISPLIYPMLQDVLKRYKRTSSGSSVFDVMTDEEYKLYNKLIDEALRRIEK